MCGFYQLGKQQRRCNQVAAECLVVPLHRKALLKHLQQFSLRTNVSGALAAAMLVLLLCGGVAAQQPPAEQVPPPEPAADESEPWTLSEVLAWTEQNSPDLPAAAAEVEVRRGRAWQAGLYPNPELQGGSTQLGGNGSQYFAMLSQEIVTKRKLQLDQAAVCREVQQAEMLFLRTRFDLLTNVRQAFYATLVAQQRLAAVDKLVTIVQRSAKAGRTLEESGDGSRADTLLLEVELERADYMLQNAAALLQASQRQLAAAMGDPDLIIGRLDGNLAAPLPDYPYQLTQAGLLTNALVQSAQIEIERNQLLLQRAVVQPFPNVTVAGGYLYQVQLPHDQAMLQVTLPLPTWNKNQGNIHAAQANVIRSTHVARKTRVDLSKQLAIATGRFDVARQQVAKFEGSILPKSRESVRLNQLGFDQGQFDLLRVLQSQRALIENELNYLTAQDARWTAAAEIAGMLQEEQFPRAVPNDDDR
jgi:cobalt-zinc-cadmium efflux system outer membrane protein